MKTIYKYEISYTIPTSIITPSNAWIIKADIQNGKFYVWAVIDDESRTEEIHHFVVVGTGHEIPFKNIDHIESIQDGPYIWHVFEVFKF